jgi:hypothetical protein
MTITKQNGKIMAKCITCGASLGFLSFEKECNTCKKSREEKAIAEKEKADKELRDIYTAALRATSLETLPALNRDLNIEQNMVVKIPLTEKIYTMIFCAVLENRVVNRKFERVGYSFPVVGLKGLRISRSSGQLITERGLVETTRGVLMLTDKRLIVDPSDPGLKPITIKYDKIEGYSVGEDYIELWMGKEYPIVIKLREKFGEESDTCAHILKMLL